MEKQQHQLRYDAEVMLEAIRQVQARFIVDSNPKHSFEEILTIILSISASEYGFIGEILQSADGTPYLKTFAITNIAWNEETKKLYDTSVIEGMEFRNLETLFGTVITTGEAVIANDPSSNPLSGGLPKGHPEMRSFLGLPFHFNGKIIGMVGMANHPSGYTQDLIDWLMPILNTCSSLIVGYQNFRARNQVEQELRESEAHLRLSQIGGGIGTWEADLVNNEQTWSDNCIALLGFSNLSPPENWDSFLALVHPQDKQKVIDATTSHIEQGTKYDVEYRVNTENGDILWIRSAGQVEHDANGKPTIMRGIAQDVTERKLFETEIRDTQLQLQATIAAIPDLLFEIDLNGRFYDSHYPSADLLAAPKDEFLGKTIFEILPPRAAEISMAALQEANLKGRSHGKQYELEVPQGKRWFELSVSRKTTEHSGVAHFIVLARDITERKNSEKKIRDLAFHDTLTKLPNRRLFMTRLEHALSSSGRSGRGGALLFIDLDNFKTINDSLGHDIGDLLLIQVAQRLESCLRDGDTVARLGGDEYVVILEFLSHDLPHAGGQTEVIGEKILTSLNHPYQLAGHEYQGSASIGATLFGDNQQSIEELMKQADIAMYQAKRSGRNMLRFFDSQMQLSVNTHAALTAELRNALDLQQFRLYYQVQVDGSREPLGAEALIRWQHPERGLVYPAEFISLAEESGLILAIDLWVLETACAQIKAWEKNSFTRDLVLAINVSAKQLLQPDFADQVQTCIEHHTINPSLLKLELNEGDMVKYFEDAVATINKLVSLGVPISLGNFGTGYSSLQHLKKLSLQQLKIDRSLLRDIANNSSDQKIVRTVIALSETMGLDVLAEGVETEAQLQFLHDTDCKHYQGYLFGGPVPIGQFEELLEQGLLV